MLKKEWCEEGVGILLLFPSTLIAIMESLYLADTPVFPRSGLPAVTAEPSTASVLAQEASKVTIVGVGAVGMACAYALLMQGTCSELVLADVDRRKLEGEVKDLQHAGAFLHARIRAASPDYHETAGSKVQTASFMLSDSELNGSLL